MNFTYKLILAAILAKSIPSLSESIECTGNEDKIEIGDSEKLNKKLTSFGCSDCTKKLQREFSMLGEKMHEFIIDSLTNLAKFSQLSEMNQMKIINSLYSSYYKVPYNYDGSIEVMKRFNFSNSDIDNVLYSFKFMAHEVAPIKYVGFYYEFGKNNNMNNRGFHSFMSCGLYL